MKTIKLHLLLVMILIANIIFAQTSWKGTTNSNWATSSNWTNGVPNSTKDVIIGDVNFTGPNQPNLNKKAVCKSLTIGTGTKVSNLTVSRNLTVMGDITIGANGQIIHNGARTIKLNGNWSNIGSYTTNNNNCIVIFAGTTQTISGNNTFRRITVNAGSTVTLLNNITINNAFIVNGTFNPTETYCVSGTASLVINSTGIILVKAANFTSNYNLSGAKTLNATSTVNYASSLLNQNITNILTYGYLRISGGTTKTLTGNLPSLNSSSVNAGSIFVDSGILDLASFTANRGTSVTGGNIVVAANATLRIGGTNAFPLNFNVVNLATSSTVEYYGNAQTVKALNYGNLTLSCTSGSVIKTMPTTAFIVAGNLTANIGTGTAVSFTAGNNITVNLNVNIGSGCTFNGGAYSHLFKLNWVNDGVFTGSTSTVTFSGTNSVLSGGGTNNFYNLVFSGVGMSALGSTSINVSGNLSTTGTGTFTHNDTGNLTMSGTAKTISGNGLHLHNLIISGTTSTDANISIAGNFTANSSFTASLGTVKFIGNTKSILGSSSITFYSLQILGTISTASSFMMLADLSIASTASFTASDGTATFNGTSSLSGTANLYTVVINAGKILTLGTNSVLGISNIFTKTGTLNALSNKPNTVVYNSANNQSVTSATYYNLIIDNGNTKTAGGALIVNGNFTINSGTTFDASTYSHSLYLDFINNGIFTSTSSTIELLGTDAANISGSTTFNNLIVNKSSSTVTITLLNSIIVFNLTMTLGNMNTGSSSVTITNTRTGNGIIIGTITHSHSFDNATAYYFEGPNNAITFTNPVGLSSVTVMVALEDVTDFITGVECVMRDYNITIPVGTFTDATLRLHYEDNELNAFIEPFLVLYSQVSGTNWDSVGFSSRDIVDNYVEKTGITNLARRWTLSGLRSIIQWNGLISSEWENPSNWTTISGSDMSNRVPTSTDAAQIGYTDFTYNPILNSTQDIAILSFGSTKAATLTINGSNILNVIGSVKGEWSVARSHVIDVASGTLNVGTNLILSNGTVNHDIQLRIGSGTVNVSNNLIQVSTGSVDFAGNGNLIISGNYNYTSGNFTPNNGTVIYSGGIPQNVAPLTYNNLSFQKTTEKAILSQPTVVNGSLTLTVGGTLKIYDTLTVNGDISIGLNTTLSHNTTKPIYLRGNWINNGFFDLGNGTVVFDGTSAQTASATAFNSVIVDKSSGTLTLTGDISLNGDLSINSGTFDLSTFLSNRNISGGNLNVDATGILIISGNDNFPSDFNTLNLNIASTVEYNGTVAQNIRNGSYGNLILSNGGVVAKSLDGNIVVNGDLLINTGASIDPVANSINLYGNLTNNGTFIPSSSTLILSGVSKTFAGKTTVNDIIVQGSYVTTADSLNVQGNFTVDSPGSFNLQTTTIVLNGDATNKGSLVSNGIAVFTGTKVQTIQLISAVTSTSTGQMIFNGTVAPVLNSTSSPVFATVKINNTGGVNASVPWTTAIAFIVGDGAIFNAGNLSHYFLGHFYNYGTFTSEGNLNFTPIYFPSNIMLDNSSTFSNTGKIIFGGNQPITISGSASEFKNVTISNTNSAGVSAHKSWTINSNLQIESGSIFNAGAYSHTIIENLTNNGEINGETSTFSFVGNPCDINGVGVSNFFNVEIGDTSDFVLKQSINIAGDLTVKTLDYATNGYGVAFIGNSTSTVNSTIGQISFDYLEQNKTNLNETRFSVPVFVENDLVLTDGIIKTTATNILTIADSAESSLGSATTYVDGPMAKIGSQAFVFPIGKSSIYSPIGIEASTDASNIITAEYFRTPPSNNTPAYMNDLDHVSLIESWQLNSIAGTQYPAVKLFWTSGVNSWITNLSDLKVGHWDGSKWQDMGGVATGSLDSGSITSVIPFTSYSPTTFASKTGPNPLLVELLSFEGKFVKDKILLNWSTASEINNDYFIIQRSENGIKFEDIAIVKAIGNSTQINSYSLEDDNPLENDNYYRLKQVDNDGKFTLSKTILIKNIALKLFDFQIAPNPLTDGETLIISLFNIEQNDKIDISIIDIEGKVYSKHVFIKKNKNVEKMLIPLKLNLGKGAYIMQVMLNSQVLNKKIIIK